MDYLENVNSNSNMSTSRSIVNPNPKSKKSLSRIKSNQFCHNLGSEIRTWASNSNLRKTGSRKRRNETSTTTSKNNQFKNVSKSYYTARDKEVSKRGINNSNILAEISESRYKRNDAEWEGSKRHWESTKVADKIHLLGQNLQMEDEQKSLHRNLLMKHAAIFNNGSQTVRNHDHKDERIFQGKVRLINFIIWAINIYTKN